MVSHSRLFAALWVILTLVGPVLAPLSGCRVSRQLVNPGPPSKRAVAIAGLAQRKLYGTGELARAATLAGQALAEDRHLAAAHEVQAQLAQLADDPEQATRHWLAALADGRNQRVELHLERIPYELLGRAQLEQLAGLLEQIARGHRDPFARDAARRRLVPLWRALGAVDRARRWLGRRALIRRWQVIAGFDNAEGKGFDTVHPPETEVELTKRYPGQRGTVGWRLVEALDPEAALDLRSHFYPFEDSVAYLLTYVESPRARRALLQLGTSDPIQVWLNDRQVLASRQSRSAARPLTVALELVAGVNKLLVKSCQGNGAWRLSAALVSEAGQPAKDLSLDPRPRPYRRDRAKPPRWQAAAALERSLSSVPAGPARGYWMSALLSRSGLRRAALSAIARQLLRWPKAAPTLALGARLNREDGQLQRAARLVLRGLKLTKGTPHAARFVIERAELFRSRGQLDRALAAVRGQLAGRRAAGPAVELLQALDKLYLRKGWHLDRCREAEAMRERRPDWSWPYEVLASCKQALGRPRARVRWLRRAVRLAPASRSLAAQLARALHAVGRCGAAVATQRRLLERWPGRLAERQRLGDLLRRCGKKREALAVYRRCARQAPRWHRPHSQEGLLHFESGDVAGALAAWQRALDRNPDDARLWDRLTYLRPQKDPVLERHRPKAGEVAQAIAAARRVKPMAGASVLWILDHEVSHLMPDGTLQRVVTLVRRAVDRAGRDALGQAKLPRRGLVKVLDAYSVDVGGRRREVTSMHGRTVRYPTLAEGAVVVLQFLHVKHPEGYLRQHLASSWYFQHGLGQLLRSRWILAVPAERELKIKLQGKVRHSSRREGSVTIHSFAADDVPPLRIERRSLPSSDLLRKVTVSTVPSWRYFSAWGRSLTSDVFELGPGGEALVRKLARGAGSEAQKVRRIYHFAVKQIRYQQDYETLIAGVKPHPAGVVLARGYGDCKDKSVLIIAMLRRLGITAHLALIRTRGKGRVVAEVPSQQFNHAVVYLPPRGSTPGRFLDATAETLDLDALRGDVQGTLALVLFADKEHRLVPVPYQPPARNRVELDARLELDRDGAAKAQIDLRMRGHRAGALRKLLQNRELLGQYGQSLVHRLYPDSSLEGIEVAGERTVRRPLSLTIRARAGGAARAEDKTLRLRAPELMGEAAALAPWTERRHPVHFGPPARLEGRLQVTLPEGFVVQSKPADITLAAPCLAVRGRWTTVATAGEAAKKLRYEQQVTRDCAVLATADYPKFRAAINSLKRSLEQDVVLAPAKPRKRRRAGKRR